jgi:hypothetical protein
MAICESCGAEMEGLNCPHCERDLPADAVYCCYCGQNLSPADAETAETETEADAPDGDPFDLENRVLCGDEACIGIINEKGVCTECGQPRKKR